MDNHKKHHRHKYFDRKMTHGFVALFTAKSITNIATGLLGLFLPIFLFDLFGQDVRFVALYYMLSSALYFLGLPWLMRYVNHFGFRRALQTSTFLGAGYYLGFFFLSRGEAFFLIPVLIILISLWRILYWVPYHVDFSKFGGKKDRCKEVGLTEATLSVIGVVTPIVAGFVITQFSYGALFFIGMIIYLSSLIPLLTIPHTRERFSWSYAKTWRQLFKPRHRQTVLSFFALGADNAISGVVWPIFIFVLLEGNYFQVGALSSLIVAVTVVLQLTVGKTLDKKKDKKILLKYGTFFYSLGWLLKVFVATAFHIFLVDSFHKLANVFTKVPFDSVAYDIASKQGHYVDEFTVVKEMAMNIGRVVTYAIVIIVASFISSIAWIFVLAALASLVFNLIQMKDKYSTKGTRK